MDVGKSRQFFLSGSKLCHHDRGILAKCANIWLSGRHVADISATFSAKVDEGVWLRPLGKSLYTMPPFNCKVLNDEHVKKIGEAMFKVTSKL